MSYGVYVPVPCPPMKADINTAEAVLEHNIRFLVARINSGVLEKDCP